MPNKRKTNGAFGTKKKKTNKQKKKKKKKKKNDQNDYGRRGLIASLHMQQRHLQGVLRPHYENTPIQIHWNVYHQKTKIFR